MGKSPKKRPETATMDDQQLARHLKGTTDGGGEVTEVCDPAEHVWVLTSQIGTVTESTCQTCGEKRTE
jgi:hypothetical protein